MHNDAIRPPAFLRNLDEARARHGAALVDCWIAGHNHGDPLADAFVAELATVGHGRGMQLLSQALSEGIDAVDDAPASLVALFEEVDTRPDWVQSDLLDRACAALVRFPTFVSITLSANSLTTGGLNGIAGKPMYITGRYTAQAGVRTLEVSSWLTAITEPGGLDRYAPGFARTVRVRVIHALVRSHCMGQWDLEAWGVPIAQPFMAFTLAEFGYLLIEGCSRLGAYYSKADKEAMYHLWRYVGYLCGVEAGLLPITEEEHRRIVDLYVNTGAGPDEDSRDFVKALNADFLGQSLASQVFSWAPRANDWTPWIVHGLQRALVGDDAADLLNIPQSAFKYAPAITGPTARFANRLRTMGRDESDARTARNLTRRNKLVDDLREKWGVRHDLVDDAPDAAAGHPANVSRRG